MNKKKLFIFSLLLSFVALGQETDSINLATNFIAKGNEKIKSQNFEQAIKHYIEAVKILEKKKDSTQLVKVYTNIGVLHARLENLDDAIVYLEKSLTHIKKEDNLKLQVLYNVSALYNDKKEIKKSLKTNKEAELLANKLNNELVLSNVYSNYSLLYNSLKKYEKSINYGKKSLDLKEKLKLNTEIINNNIGYSYLLDNQYNNAISYFNKIEATKNKTLQVLVFNNLKNAYNKKGNKEIALRYANQLLNLKDSLNNAQQKIKVASLVEKYESEKKQQKIDVLNIENQLQQTKFNNQRTLFSILFILVLLILILIYLWFKNQKTKQSLQQASLQHKLLQTQLNPHFLFHSLNSIQSFIYQNKKEESANYLASYSKLMRAILENSDQDFISVEQDVHALKEYINLQQLNLSREVKYVIKVAPEVKQYKIPPMFVQPYLENAILHGVNSITNGKITLVYSEETNYINVTIIDNGKGIKKRHNNTSLHRSMSTAIINKRIENLQKTHQYSIKKTIISNENGTTITLLFPKKKVL